MSDVSNNPTQGTPKKAKDPLWKRLYMVFSATVLAILAANYAWIASGSGKWELYKDEDGVQTYTMKLPGDPLLKVKSVMEGDYRLSQLAAQHLIVGDTLANCIKWIPGCKKMTRIEDFDPVKGYDKDMWQVELPGPFADRELLITTMFEQNKQTKEVTLDVVSLPNTLPPTPGVVRIERMHNRWTYTPKPNGKVQVSLVQDVDLPGIGFFPYFLLNMTVASHSQEFFTTTLRQTLKEDRYVNAKLDFIDDIR